MITFSFCFLREAVTSIRLSCEAAFIVDSQRADDASHKSF